MTIKTKYGTAYLDKRGYYVISSSKEGNRGKNLHRLIYEDYYDTTIPKGMQIHHLDGNTTNNNPLNLEMISISEHNRRHNKGAKSGEDNFMHGKKHSDETKHKISIKAKERWANPENRQKMSEIRTKKFATIIKASTTHNGKQRYAITFHGKKLKSSIYPHKLLEYFTENFPNQILHLRITKEMLGNGC